jgi:hypothetical protein
MTKRVQYFCNLCGSEIKLNREVGELHMPGVGVEFKAEYVSGQKTGNRDHLVIGPFDQTVRHLCTECIADVVLIANSLDGKTR